MARHNIHKAPPSTTNRRASIPGKAEMAAISTKVLKPSISGMKGWKYAANPPIAHDTASIVIAPAVVLSNAKSLPVGMCL